MLFFPYNFLKIIFFLPNLKSRESLMRNKLSKSPIFERLVFQRYNAMKIYSSPVRDTTLVIYHTHTQNYHRPAGKQVVNTGC